MGTNRNQQQMRRRQIESWPQHFCERCSTVRNDGDAVCMDCQSVRPEGGWSRLEDAFDPFLGRLLDERYHINKIEGRGSSSTIYRAESLAGSNGVGINKQFAIKMVKLWHSEKRVTEEARARVEREVRAVGMLKNPHIVRVYELLELDQDWIALVMDHIDGQTLEERVEERGPLSVERACALMRQMAQGLCEAHDAGMIHRDIKPANIMLEQLPDGDDFAYLLDFGVVHLEGEAKMTHGFLGTPLFASPEQATATAIDRRSDIYSLGATFFHMLTGRAPFDSERTFEVLQAHVHKTAPTLASVCPERDFPAVVEALIAKMLAKAPKDRPVNLYEVLQALNGLEEISGRRKAPIQARPAESADLTDGLGLEDSCDEADLPRNTAFQDRPKTMLGVRHAVEILPGTSTDGSEEQQRESWRPRRDSSELSPLRKTNPGGFDRPSTGPRQDRPRQDGPRQDGPAKQAVGIAFARTIRRSGASSENLIAFVDSHNEVWTVGDDELMPVATPLSRVCSVSASEEGAYVGLADGSISRVLADRQGLDLLFGDDDERAITALATTRSGTSLLAGTADGTLYLGRLDQKYERWMALHANRGIAAVAMTPSGGLFAAASLDGFVRVASTDTPGTAIAKLIAGGHVADLAFCNDGHLLAVLLDDGRIPIFQVLDGRQISVLTPDCPTPRSVYFSRENILYGVSSAGGRIARWNLTTSRAAQYE